MASKSDKFEKYDDLLRPDFVITAEYFARVWEHFDADGNGYIEGKELTNFVKELIGCNMDSEKYSETMFDEIVRDIMDGYDKNKDGKIEMRELAEFLKPEENFLLLFRSLVPISSVEFMAIWRQFDADSNGFIDADELRNFIGDLITKNKSGEPGESAVITDEKLEEYTQTILKLFDTNNDGKLELKEMAKLLPTEENFLKQFQKITGFQGPGGKGILGQKRLTRAEFERVFSYYDKDKNGTIEGDELTGFLKDLIELEGKKEMSMAQLHECCQSLLRVCDQNNDGVIQKSELEMFIRPSDQEQEPQE